MEKLKVARRGLRTIAVGLVLLLGGLAMAGEISFQQGVNGYSGAADKTIDQAGQPVTDVNRLRLQYDVGQERHNSLLKFSQLEQFLAGKVITGAKLVLTFRDEDPEWAAAWVNFYLMPRDWQESMVSWTKYNASDLWQSPGAAGVNDRGGFIGSITMGTRTPPWNNYYDLGPYQFTLPARLVQEWVDNPSLNFGMLITMAHTVNNGVTFSSSDDPDNTAYRPKLVVTYSDSCMNLQAGDFNHDCTVSLADFTMLAEKWLAQGYSNMDLNHDNAVDLIDVAQFESIYNYTTVPEVTGLPEAAARDLLTWAGLASQFIYHYSDTIAAGEVFQQDPAAQTGIGRGSAVTCWVSRGLVTCDFAPNSSVDLEDYALLVNEMGQCGNLITDLDNSGCVDLNDFNIFVTYWGSNYQAE